MRKGKKFKYFLGLFCIGVFAYLSIEPLYTPTAISVQSNMFNFPEVIAHKSIVSGDFPGNSLGAIQEALASSVDGIEVDVRCSKDSILFLYHGQGDCMKLSSGQ